MAGSAKRGAGIFEDCNRRGQESDRRLYRIVKHDLQRHRQKGNDSMKLYLSVDTDIEDLEIDYIEVKLVTGKTVTVDWDESDITREDDGFEARYKGGF